MKVIGLFVLLVSFQSFACDGGMALNKRQISIPVNSALANDITEKEFKNTIKEFQDFFLDEVESRDKAELIVIGSWASNTVNAYAEQISDWGEKKYYITVYGGLARHKDITKDGLVAVLCHELGHHFGGYPKKTTNRWSSAEGQADYYTTMKCLRRVWEKSNNTLAIQNITIPSTLKTECEKTYGNDKELALCQRMAMAGRSVSLMIQDLDHDSFEPKFETPDPQIVRAMNYMHPYAQCRLDTFFQGSICPVSQSVEFDDDNEEVGACHQINGDLRGLRPKCWFLSKK